MSKKVLVIDDEKLLVKSTCMALSYYGFEVLGALGGLEGIKVAKETRPGIILLDITMPGIDGWQVLSELKSSNETKDIPIIVFTAEEHSNGTVMAQSKGAVDYIAKPFEPDELVEIINKNIRG
jgi:DNA-binding response OmpR family regulator